MTDIKQLKEIALANILQSDYDYFYRYVCRWYSKTFHTPLHEVYDLSPDDVFLHYFEEGYERIRESEEGEETIAKDIMRAINPDWTEEEEEDLKDFIEMLEEEMEMGIKPTEAGKKSKSRQSLQGDTKKGLENLPPKTVVKTFEEVEEGTASEEVGDNGLDDLEDIVKDLGEDQT